jgi:hypothetical protein
VYDRRRRSPVRVGHGWTFDLKTGAVVRRPGGYKVAAYPVRVFYGEITSEQFWCVRLDLAHRNLTDTIDQRWMNLRLALGLYGCRNSSAFIFMDYRIAGKFDEAVTQE